MIDLIMTMSVKLFCLQ